MPWKLSNAAFPARIVAGLHAGGVKDGPSWFPRAPENRYHLL
jgi:hypothetical protein